MEDTSFDISSPPHVQYILLAEFDIGKGASLTHQFPCKTDMDEHVLAEMMLPDGVHQREEDWTIFFLNQSPTQDIDPVNQDVTPKELLYVLSLVITKHDREALRGAHVKAMAICTKHRYLHIYKPVLLLALENYFRNPTVEVLSSLYDAVNSMDVSLMPEFSIHEKMILRASEDKDMFEEKFLEKENASEASGGVSPALSLAQVETNKRHTYIDLPSGQRKEVVNKNKDRHFFETTVTYEKVKIPIRVPLTIFPEEVGDFSLINLITTFANATMAPHPFHPHLDTSGPHTHPLILLLNALITEKRVIFLGHGLPSGQVANYVLAACAMASGSGIVLRGFLERAFPYTSLSDIDTLLKFRGFIAGVANPTFEGHPKWWDVLCNISTGKITVSPYVGMGDDATIPPPQPLEAPPDATHQRAPSNPKWDGADADFVGDVLLAIQAHYGELAIRGKFSDYVQRFVGIAALCDDDPSGNVVVFPDEASRIRELAANKPRIEGWKLSLSYQYYCQDFQRLLRERSIPNMLPQRQIAKLRIIKNIPDKELEAIYRAFLDNVVTSSQIIEFLAAVPQNQGGLTPITVALFHPSKTIRNYTVQFLNRIDQHQVPKLIYIANLKTGTRFIQNLNLFHKLAYERQCLAYEPNDENFKVLAPYVDSPRADLADTLTH
ncbi:hypothetical protein DSO57_1018082 [Entomophthora muscae]|uniref:Uncharacterized protein n=1 Tax=Entomophthora muscae TaxID=34485 RepID=A0ACC2RVH5_9FUNG|nr:hypothetical protein DSO57_1018082 [Entomophthora muscae]